MIYPADLELLEFFGVEPERLDGVTLFRVSDSMGISLEFSYSEAEDSVQTALLVAGRRICVVCQEGMSRLWFDRGTLRADFTFGDNTTALSLHIRPTIRVNWSCLRSS